ncbi:MAG: aldo/keto reductase [Rothia sp. (in: high G+C Gram-positive bacteria)]|nr:aldo/keto reductase [Rothia sp. (in: high G+C Gram-positive bacteria)]
MSTRMHYRQLGKSGLRVSSVGLGCNNLGRPGTPTYGQDAVNRVVSAAYEAGINLFDIADVYGEKPGKAETMFGKALTYLGPAARDSMLLVSKFGMDLHGGKDTDRSARGSRSYIMRALEASLRRLGSEHIDLYIYHTPDGKTPADETLSALNTLIDQGKVRYIGHSNHTGWQIAQAEYLAQNLGKQRYIAAENHYNLLDRRAELEVIPAAQHFGLGLLPYFPLANGLLTGKYKRNQQAPTGSRLSHSKTEYLKAANWEQLEAFDQFCRQSGISQVQAAFSWLAQKEPVASIIAGATTVQQVAENAQAASYRFSQQELARLDQIFPAPEKIAPY